jgi:hypothetical protein
MDSQAFVYGTITGGGLLQLVKLFIDWRKEKREQQSQKTSKEKDRPRFRVDVKVVRGTNYNVPIAEVSIRNLGGVPLKISEGEIWLEASHYTSRLESKSLTGREISNLHPIPIEFSLPIKITSPTGEHPPTVKIICQFSFGVQQEFRDVKIYNGREFVDFVG